MGNTIRARNFTLWLADPCRYRHGFSSLVASVRLAWPRFQASFRYLPVERAIKQYYKTGEIPTDRLPVLIRFAQQAIAHNDHYRYHDGLSPLHYLRAMDYYTPALERRAAYVSLTEAVMSLQQAPAHPASLAASRLGALDSARRAGNHRRAWKMSIFTGDAFLAVGQRAWRSAWLIMDTWTRKAEPCCATSCCWPGGCGRAR